MSRLRVKYAFKLWPRQGVSKARVGGKFNVYFHAALLVRLSPLGTAATTGLLYQLQMIDDDECGAVGEMRIGRGN
jgi:hypothetical protein